MIDHHHAAIGHVAFGSNSEVANRPSCTMSAKRTRSDMLKRAAAPEKRPNACPIRKQVAVQAGSGLSTAVQGQIYEITPRKGGC